MAEKPKLVVQAKTLAEMCDAIEGYRGQLSAFSDTALLELEKMKSWIRQEIAADAAARIALVEVPRK
jgi:hypothetical protein